VGILCRARMRGRLALWAGPEGYGSENSWLVICVMNMRNAQRGEFIYTRGQPRDIEKPRPEISFSPSLLGSSGVKSPWMMRRWRLRKPSVSDGPSANQCPNTGLLSLIGWNMHLLRVLGLGVTAKVRTSYGPRTEETLQAYRGESSASAREEPKAQATSTQRLAAADIRLFVVPLGSQLLSVGLRSIG
jgi:hypothetical protein